MTTTFTIKRSEIDKLWKKSKLLTFLSTNKKLIVEIENQQLKLFLFNKNSLFKTTIAISSNTVTTPCSFVIDTVKFLSSLKKFSSEDIEFLLTPQLLTIVGVNERISVGISSLEDEITIESLENELNNKLREIKQQENAIVTVTDDCNHFFQACCALMNNYSTNNCVVVDSTSLSYADRSIIWKKFIYNQSITFHRLSQISIPKTGLVLIDLLYPEQTEFTITSQYLSTISPQEDLVVIYALEPSKLNIPTEDDMNNLIPLENEKITVSIDPAELLNSIQFFSGMFDTSVWKPIMFTYHQGKMILSHKTPTTELEKELPIYLLDQKGISDDTPISFSLISDALKTTALVTDHIIHLTFNDKKISEPQGVGVLCEYYATNAQNSNRQLNYRIIFAKINED